MNDPANLCAAINSASGQGISSGYYVATVNQPQTSTSNAKTFDEQLKFIQRNTSSSGRYEHLKRRSQRYAISANRPSAIHHPAIIRSAQRCMHPHPYDSGFGSNLSASTRSSSSLTGTVATTTGELPPPPRYPGPNLRGQHQPRLRGARLHRSYSDSRHGTAGLGAAPRHWRLPALTNTATPGAGAGATTSCRSSWAAASRSPSPSMSTVSCPEYGDIQNKLHRLESDRESLCLQVSVLNEQVGAQTEKIKDLESMLDDKLHRLDSTEEMLHVEFKSRTALESSKLDLLTQISNLKLQLACIQREKLESEQRMMQAQSDIGKLQKLLRDRHVDVSSRYGPNFSGMFNQINEIDELRSAVQQLMIDNEEKDQKIAELKAIVGTNSHMNTSISMGSSGFESYISNNLRNYGRVSESDNHATFDLNAQLRQLLTDDFEPTSIQRMPLSISYPMSFHASKSNAHSTSYQAALSCPATSSSLTTTPVASAPMVAQDTLLSPGSQATTPHSSEPSPAPTATPRRPSATPSNAARQLAAELDLLAPALRQTGFGSSPSATGSLPRYVGSSQKPPVAPKLSGSISAASSTECRASRSTQPSSSKGIRWLKEHLRPGKRSTSAPNLDSDDETVESAGQLNEKLKRDKKHKSVRGFISRLKKSTSQEAKRGEEMLRRDAHTRHTVVAPRCRAWSRDAASRAQVPLRPSFEQFSQWGAQTLSDWLVETGLGDYAAECGRNIKSGRHLISLTPADLERDLGIKNRLHQKKLATALRGIELGRSEPADNLDCHQVLRWLDDVGLPQYRDVFAENRIDGSVLNLLTVEDLLWMKVGSALHHASLQRGLEVLRQIDFKLNRLQRKFDPDVLGKGPVPLAVRLWTQQQVSEWLRTIDLAEFTPNLMCAGVHGALMVLEPRFTAETLASVLDMPPQKSLLRRHLAMHFGALLGADVLALKRDQLGRPGALELTPGARVKSCKKGAVRRRHRADVLADPDELLCPLTPSRRPSRCTPLQESISEQLIAQLASSNV